MGKSTDGLIFTGVDKALLDRAARILEGMAKDLESDCDGNWGASKATRKMKDEYDVLMRDARDLRALGKRMVGVARQVAQEGEALAAAEREIQRAHALLNDKDPDPSRYVPAQAESVPQVRGGVTYVDSTTTGGAPS